LCLVFFFKLNLFSLHLLVVAVRPPPQDVNVALMATPAKPPINGVMPKSFAVLLTEWTNMDLERFRHSKFTRAETSMAQAYGKRKYLFDTIRRRQQEGQTLQESALSLDRERHVEGARPTTMTNFYRSLHADDDRISRRQKRQNPNPEATPPRNQRAFAAPPPQARAAPQARARGPPANPYNPPPIGGWPAPFPLPTPRIRGGLRDQIAQDRAWHNNRGPNWEGGGHTSGHMEMRDH
jgi:hypothetical protein